MDFTCVEIRNIKYIKLLDLDRKNEKELDLTTIHKDQELAYLNIYYVDDDRKKQVLKSIQINNIRPGQSGIPELHLIVKYDGSRYYKIILKVNGFIYHNSVIDIRAFRKSHFPLLRVLGFGAAAILLGLLIFFSVRTFSGMSRAPSSADPPKLPESKPEVAVTTPEEKQAPQVEEPDRGEEATEQKPETTTSPEEHTVDRDEESEKATSTEETSASEETSSEVSVSTVEASAQEPAAADETTDTEVSEPVEEPVPEAPPVIVNEQATVYFDPNSTALSSLTIRTLDTLLSILQNNEGLDVEIIGHCAFYGTEKGRQEISAERAENVYAYFVGKGWTPEKEPRLDGRGHLEIVTKDPEKQNLNRRVEISIITAEEE